MARRPRWRVRAGGRGARYRRHWLTWLGSLIWAETGGKVSLPLPSAPTDLAGEHLSNAFPGFGKGDGRTGRLDVEAVSVVRAVARQFGWEDRPNAIGAPVRTALLLSG